MLKSVEGEASRVAPLAGVRVVDLVDGSLAVIGRTFAELGADVIRLEPPGGVRDRTDGACFQSTSLEFLCANIGKRPFEVHADRPDDVEAVERLFADADIVLESRRPRSHDTVRVDLSALRARHPHLVVLSVSDFAATGSFAEWQATGPVVHALSSGLSRSGLPGRPPLLPPGRLAENCAAQQAVFVALSAYYRRSTTGLGDWLDFSFLEGTTQALDPGFGIAGSATGGSPLSDLPRGRIDARHQYPVLPCRDGFVRICVLAARQWRGMFEWMGSPDEFADPVFEKLRVRFQSKTLLPAIARFFADQTRAELEEGGQRHGVPTAAILSLAEALETEQMVARQALRTIALVPGYNVRLPDGVMVVDGARMRTSEQLPALASIQEARWSEPREPKSPGCSSNIAANARPLAGLKVLDLGVIVVGAEQSRLLADLGADVLKVEAAAFPDGARQTLDGSAMSASFAAGHRNKRGLGLNLRSPKGKAVFLRLVEAADVLLSNFKPGTLESLGFGANVLQAINPRLIMADSSAFGATGPWSRRMGYGPLVRASSGLAAAWVYPGEEDTFSDTLTVYPDHVGGRVSAVGVLALLIRRQRTGRGGTLGVSQAEIILSHLAPDVAALDLRAAGETVDDSGSDAPWGVFPCAGDDEWCVVTVRDDEDWRRFCAVIGAVDLAEDPALCDRGGRNRDRHRIDAKLTAWLTERSPRAAMDTLQAAGVPAGAMMRASELPDWAYFRERDLFRRATHPGIADPFYAETRPVRAEHLPDPDERPAPLVGQDSVEVLRDWLGLSEANVRHLIDSDVVEVPDPVALRETTSAQS